MEGSSESGRRRASAGREESEDSEASSILSVSQQHLQQQYERQLGGSGLGAGVSKESGGAGDGGEGNVSSVMK